MNITVGDLTRDQLAVTHVTQYKPIINAQGLLTIPTTSDALGGLDQDPNTFTFRNTVHTALNGVVGSHMMGNWDEMNYVVVAPFNNATDLNGSPAGFNTVDTFWAFDEGQPMRLSEYKVIQPDAGILAPGEFMREEGNNVYFRTSFSDDERLSFMRDFLVSHSEKPYAAQAQRKAYSDFIWSLKGQPDLKCIPADFYCELNGPESDLEKLEGFILGGEEQDRKIIDQFMASKIRNIAVRKSVEGYGCTPKTCGTNYWVDDPRTSGSEEFAESVGSKFLSHTYSAQGALEKLINGTSVMGLLERASPNKVRVFIEENRAELTAQSVIYAEKIIGSEMYSEACMLRQEILKPRHPDAGHNGGPPMPGPI